MKKRIFALMMAIVFCIGVFPVMTIATGETTITVVSDSDSPQIGDVVTFTVYCESSVFNTLK